MFEEDEEEQELLRHYEDLNFHGDAHQSSSSDELDSDLEDAIRSMVEYGSSKSKTSKKLPGKTTAPDQIKNGKAAAAHADSSDQEEESDEEPRKETSPEDIFFDAKEASGSDEDSSDDSSNDDDDSALSSDESDNESIDENGRESDVENDSEGESSDNDGEPRVTRVIDLDLNQPRYIDEEEESEEERGLNDELQNLIQDQIERKQLAKRNFHVRRVPLCYNCQQPGHEGRKCPLCTDCGAPKHSDRCPGLKHCTYCKRRGHVNRECLYEKETRSCSLCGLSYHSSLHCPSLVHIYREKVLNQGSRNGSNAFAARSFCYNCGQNTHYGDDCPALPMYLKEVPSAFSKENITTGSRFSMKKNMKASASAFANGERRQHKRWTDSSSGEGSRHDRSPPTKRGRKDEGGQYLGTFFQSTSAPEKHYQPSVRHHQHHHQQQQSSQQRHSSPSPRISTPSSSTSARNVRHGNTQLERGTGNNNWNNIPKPTRSGTVSFNQDRRNMDFPRNNLPPMPGLPKPSSSGVIDIPRMSSSHTPQSQRQPRFRGGYSRG